MRIDASRCTSSVVCCVATPLRWLVGDHAVFAVSKPSVTTNKTTAMRLALLVFVICLLMATPVASFSVASHSQFHGAELIRSDMRLFLSKPGPFDEVGANEEDEDFAAKHSRAAKDEGVQIHTDDLADDADTQCTLSANPGYGYGQIQNARESPNDKRLTEEENEARRRKKVNDWISALSSSNLRVGGTENPLAIFPFGLRRAFSPEALQVIRSQPNSRRTIYPTTTTLLLRGSPSWIAF